MALPNPVMTASGTAGHGAEFQSFFDLADLGAHVVKSLAAFAWEGNPAPRLHPAGAGMINAVGSVAGFAGPYLFGYMNTRTGSFSSGLAVMMVAALAGALLILCTPRCAPSVQRSPR